MQRLCQPKTTFVASHGLPPWRTSWSDFRQPPRIDVSNSRKLLAPAALYWCFLGPGTVRSRGCRRSGGPAQSRAGLVVLERRCWHTFRFNPWCEFHGPSTSADHPHFARGLARHQIQQLFTSSRGIAMRRHPTCSLSTLALAAAAALHAFSPTRLWSDEPAPEPLQQKTVQQKTVQQKTGQQKIGQQKTGQQKEAIDSREAAFIAKVRGKLEGDWVIVAGVNQGRRLSAEELKGSHVLFRKNSIIVFDRSEKEIYRARFEVEATAREPYKLNMVSDTPNAPRTVALAIVAFGKDRWKLAYGLPGEERPEKFVSAPGSGVMLFELEAVEPKQAETPEVKPKQ